ncbi:MULTISPECIES: glucose 1-dehydrogenase [unclassified Mycobacterium]|uniref:glucose 1-dehydrogenase n=1 Tax=unclassified Mycobacterium TaxID=2642494 RepID=UPI0029C92F60|nr:MULTISPECIES: glucose 1-dehydrogenase [unclassified Mycobacterium]
MAVDHYRLDGKVALVTGAGRGIGAGIAVALAEAGANVAITARTKDDIEGVAERIRAVGREALAVPADVTDHVTLPGLVAETVAAWGRLDVVVNNAGGVEALGPFMDVTVERLESALHFNVSTPFELTKLAVPHMLANDGGAVVNIGSMAGMMAERGFLSYSLSKAALGQLTRLAAVELSPRIRVNAVFPGAIETDALKGFLDVAPPEVRGGMQEKTPMRRNGTPADIASAVRFLASPAASWITGKLLEVDGAAGPGMFPTGHPDL